MALMARFVKRFRVLNDEPTDIMPSVPEEHLTLFNILSTRIRPTYRDDLSVRALNCCIRGRIETIGDLVQFSKVDILKFRFLGKKTMNEFNDFLGKLSKKEGINVFFGMPIPDYMRPSVLTIDRHLNE